MIKTENKLQLYLPDERMKRLDEETIEKIEFLKHESHIVSPIYMMPDLSGDGYILSGTTIKSHDYFYPLSAGADIGCGYRLLHSPLTKKDIDFIEKDIDGFAKQFITKDKSIEEVALFEWFWEKKYEKLKSYFALKHNINSSIILPRNPFNSHQLSSNSLLDAWGNIAIGNHFVEVREIGNIRNKEVANDLNIHSDEIMVHIHSGSGKKIENEFIHYWIKFIKQFKEENHFKNEMNGYEICMSMQTELARQFLDDAVDSINFSVFNRSLLSSKLQLPFNNTLIDFFDAFHDGYSIEGNSIVSQKGIQPFKEVNGHLLAIVPGSLNSNSYLVKKKGEIPFINHGTGEGLMGNAPNYKNVVTNLKKPIHRKYHDIESTIAYAEGAGLFEVIAELKPWICIKKEGENQ